MRVDLHNHSSFSDGERSPEQLADLLAVAQVRWAALTDHETTHGQARFHAALAERGIQTINGVEIEAQSQDGLVHLLAYGFDLHHAGFNQLLADLRNPFWMALRSWISRLFHLRSSTDFLRQGNGRVKVFEVIQQVKQAGGCVFLAHPSTTFPDRNQLEKALANLSSNGLDGIEAYYKPYPPNICDELAKLAMQYNLLVCAGSDFHSTNLHNGMGPGIDMPEADWQRFYERVVQKN